MNDNITWRQTAVVLAAMEKLTVDILHQRV